jgi:hypothetical protein
VYTGCLFGEKYGAMYGMILRYFTHFISSMDGSEIGKHSVDAAETPRHRFCFSYFVNSIDNTSPHCIHNVCSPASLPTEIGSDSGSLPFSASLSKQYGEIGVIASILLGKFTKTARVDYDPSCLYCSYVAKGRLNIILTLVCLVISAHPRSS